MNDEKAAMEEDAKKAKSELDAAYEIISAMKMKEEEMAKKEKKMNRQASLIEQGIDTEIASTMVEKFESLADETFDSMTSLFAGKMPPWLEKIKKNEDPKSKKEEEAVMKPTKKMAAEESVSALEDVEAEEVVALSVGGDDTESQTDTIRAELVEFVSARLSKNSK
jgi:hypothetical protein